MPVADLEVTVSHPEHEPVTYRIVCLGDTATITGDVDLDEQAACSRLNTEEVRNRLTMEQPDRVCTEQYGGPETAVITGSLDDIAVDARIDRSNGCGISDWDELLRDVLPAATGVAD